MLSLSTNKLVISLPVLKRLMEEFPDMKVLEAVEFIKMAWMIKDTQGIDVNGITNNEGVVSNEN